MQNDFICTFCEGQLRVGDYIILAARTKDNKSGLILLSPQVGNYTSVKHSSFKIEEGTLVDFYCPVCQTSLTSDIEKNLAKVIMVDSDGKESEIFFSKITGEKSTYKITEDKVEFSGKDSPKYKKLFKL